MVLQISHVMPLQCPALWLSLAGTASVWGLTRNSCSREVLHVISFKFGACCNTYGPLKPRYWEVKLKAPNHSWATVVWDKISYNYLGSIRRIYIAQFKKIWSGWFEFSHWQGMGVVMWPFKLLPTFYSHQSQKILNFKKYFVLIESALSLFFFYQQYSFISV